MAHGHEAHPVAVLGSKKDAPAVKDESTIKSKRMVLKSDETQGIESGSPPHDDEPAEVLSLWRVRILLGLIIVSMVAALGVAVMQTARVFGLLPEASASYRPANSSKGESDPESLTRLLSSHTGEGFGAIFASRGFMGQMPTLNEEKPKIVIQ